MSFFIDYLLPVSLLILLCQLLFAEEEKDDNFKV